MVGSFFLYTFKANDILCVLEGNPYIVKATKARRRFRPEVVGGKPVEVVDTQTGEVTVGTQLIGRQKLYDSSEFIKWYDPKVLIGLSVAAVAVFSYIVNHLRFGGIVQFCYTEAMEYTGYKNRQTIWRGVQELEQKDIIRPKQKGEYWVNPNIVYRGQRDEFEVI